MATTIPLSVRADLTVLYNEPHRHYHNMAHIQHCLRELEAFAQSPEGWRLEASGLVDFAQVEWAIWFHDSVYDPQSKMNEENSADLLTMAASTGGISRNPARRLVLATKHSDQPLVNLDENVMVDIDLAILGQDESTYLAYAHNIRREYSFVPWNVYREARKLILQGFLNRARIYSTDYFHSKYEQQARANLTMELDRLGRGVVTF